MKSAGVTPCGTRGYKTAAQNFFCKAPSLVVGGQWLVVSQWSAGGYAAALPLFTDHWPLITGHCRALPLCNKVTCCRENEFRDRKSLRQGHLRNRIPLFLQPHPAISISRDAAIVGVRGASPTSPGGLLEPLGRAANGWKSRCPRTPLIANQDRTPMPPTHGLAAAILV